MQGVFFSTRGNHATTFISRARQSLKMFHNGTLLDRRDLVVVAEVGYYRPVPDDDVMFNQVSAGACLEIDGVLYIRQSKWQAFLLSAHQKASMQK